MRCGVPPCILAYARGGLHAAIASAVCCDICAFPHVSAAQVLTGVLFGSVKDEQHAILVGAVVRATSPASLGCGDRHGERQEQRYWRLYNCAMHGGCA